MTDTQPDTMVLPTPPQEQNFNTGKFPTQTKHRTSVICPTIDLYTKQCAIVLLIIFICVLVSLSLLCVSILNDMKEMRTFHSDFLGRKMLVEDGKLEYREMVRTTVRFRLGQVTLRRP